MKKNLVLRKAIKRKYKKQDFIIGIMIIAAGVLITACMLLVGDLKNANDNLAFIYSGTDAPGLGNLLTEDEVIRLKENPKIHNVGSALIGAVINNSGFTTERYTLMAADKDFIKMSRTNPTTGRMPVSTNEIAVSEKVLDKLKVEKKIGTTIKLELATLQGIKSHSFKLSGFWENNGTRSDEFLYSEKKFIQKLNKENDQYDPNGQRNMQGTGYYITSFYPADHSVVGKESFIEEIEKESNIPKTAKMQWVSAHAGVNGDSYGIGIIVAGFMITALFLMGYLMVRTVFQISVVQDMEFWGLLRVLGVTSKQTRNILHLRMWRLVGLYIPISLGVGYFLRWGFLIILRDRLTLPISMFKDILIYLVIASFVVFLAIYLAIRYLIRCVQRIEPLTLYSSIEEHGSNIKAGKIRDSNMLYNIAIDFIRFHKQKYFMIIGSFVLAIFLIYSTAAVVSGLNKNKYVNENVLADYVIKRKSQQIGDLKWNEKNNLPEDLTKKIIKYKRNDQINLIRGIITSHLITQSEKDRHKEYQRYLSENNFMPSVLQKDVAVLAVNDFGLKDFQIKEGGFDKKLYRSGKYVLINPAYTTQGKEEILYKPSENIILKDSKGKDHRYTVMAIGQIKAHHRIDGINVSDQQTIYLPEKEYNMYFTKPFDERLLMMNTNKKEIPHIDKIIDQYMKKELPDLDVDSVTQRSKDFDLITFQIRIITITLLLIFLVAYVIQFLNVTINNIQDQKKPLLLLEIIGATKKQLNQIFFIQSTYLTVVVGLISLFITLPLTVWTLRIITREISFVTIRYNIHYMVFCFVVIFLGNYLLNTMLFKYFSKRGVLEEFRQE